MEIIKLLDPKVTFTWSKQLNNCLLSVCIYIIVYLHLTPWYRQSRLFWSMTSLSSTEVLTRHCKTFNNGIAWTHMHLSTNSISSNNKHHPTECLKKPNGRVQIKLKHLSRSNRDPCQKGNNTYNHCQIQKSNTKNIYVWTYLQVFS